MKLILKAQILLIILLTFSCGKSEEVFPLSAKECIEETLEKFDMRPYENEEIHCEFFLTYHTFENKSYFMFNSHCADIALDAFDCDGINLCGEVQNENCDRFFQEAIGYGIVGISK